MILAIEVLEKVFLVLGPLLIAVSSLSYCRSSPFLTVRHTAYVALGGLLLLMLLVPLNKLWGVTAEHFDPEGYQLRLALRNQEFKTIFDVVKVLSLLVGASVAFWLVHRPPQGLICTRCGSEDIGRYTQGSTFIALILWLCAIVPGLIYTIWRSNGRHKYHCEDCGSVKIISIDSPKGQRLLREMLEEEEPSQE